MDFAAFETDVWADVNESTYAEQWGDANSAENFTGVVFTIGETWQGTLYGAEENSYGQRRVYQFDTETEQRVWFDNATGEHSPVSVFQHTNEHGGSSLAVATHDTDGWLSFTVSDDVSMSGVDMPRDAALALAAAIQRHYAS